MPEMIYGQSLGISVPAGWYNTRFAGTEPRPDMVGSMPGKNQGKPQPRMAWVFEVTDGPYRGERVAQETGTAPVQRSGALRMLTGLNGGPMAIGQRVNPDTYVGRPYRIKVEPNPASDKGNLHVGAIEPGAAAPPQQSGNSPPPASWSHTGPSGTTVAGGGPPPAPPQGPPLGAPPGVGAPEAPACDPAEPWVWWDAANEREQPMTRGDLFDMIKNDSRTLDGYVKRPGATQWVKVSATDLQVPF